MGSSTKIGFATFWWEGTLQWTLPSRFIRQGNELVRYAGFSKRVYGSRGLKTLSLMLLVNPLVDIAQKYHRRKVTTWWSENQTLLYAMQRLLHTCNTKISLTREWRILLPLSHRRVAERDFLVSYSSSEECGGMLNISCTMLSAMLIQLCARRRCLVWV